MRRTMMRGAMLGLAVPLMLLAACDMKIGKDDSGKDLASVKVGEDGNVAITANESVEGVSLSIPGFQGKMKIPAMELGGGNMDIDGIKLYPGSKLHGINITDQKGRGNGLVDMRFTAPAPPDKVAAHFADSARDNDFSDIKVTKEGGTATMTARKAGGDDLRITMAPEAGGTKGQILIRDAARQ